MNPIVKKPEDTFEYWVTEASKGRNIAECWQNCYRIQTKLLEEVIDHISFNEGWEETGDKYRKHFGIKPKYEPNH